MSNPTFRFNESSRTWIPVKDDFTVKLPDDYPDWQGEQCVVCGKDSWTCEHFDPREEAEKNQ